MPAHPPMPPSPISTYSATSAKFRDKIPKDLTIQPGLWSHSYSSSTGSGSGSGSDDDEDNVVNISVTSPDDDGYSSECSYDNNPNYHLPLRTAPLMLPTHQWFTESDNPEPLVPPSRCRSAPIPETACASAFGPNWNFPYGDSAEERELLRGGWAYEKEVEEVEEFFREEFMSVLEKRREDADVSLCERMMEEMAEREEMEMEIEKLLGPGRGLKRRRSIV